MDLETVYLVTRAIHLELARDKSGLEFLKVLTRFGSLRGCPKFIVSDNDSHFEFIQPFVGEKVNVSHTGLANHCNTHGISWKFIPSYSPWQGGAYERLVALVKNALKKSYGIMLLDYVDFSTVIYQIIDMINSRPLTYVSSDEILTPLTPNNFLRLRSIEANASIEVNNPRTGYNARKVMKLWKDVRNVVENFWNVFESMYLASLRETHVAIHPPAHGSVAIQPRVSEIVLIKDMDNKPRAKWQFGRILSLDNRNAVAVVRRSTGDDLTRSINHLYPLELSFV